VTRRRMGKDPARPDSREHGGCARAPRWTGSMFPQSYEKKRMGSRCERFFRKEFKTVNHAVRGEESGLFLVTNVIMAELGRTRPCPSPLRRNSAVRRSLRYV